VHLRKVEQSRICGRKVVGNEDEGSIRLGHTRRGHTPKLGNDALGDIGKVRRPLRHVPAHILKNLRKRGESLKDRALGVRAGLDSLTNVGSNCGVSRHQGLRLQHRLGLSLHGKAALRQPRRHTVQGVAGPFYLGVSLGRAWRIRCRRQGFRHAQNHASRNSRADSRTTKFHDSTLLRARNMVFKHWPRGS
jgi:hypothetical protein